MKKKKKSFITSAGILNKNNFLFSLNTSSTITSLSSGIASFKAISL